MIIFASIFSPFLKTFNILYVPISAEAGYTSASSLIISHFITPVQNVWNKLSDLCTDPV